MHSVGFIWLQFVLCAALIGIAGYHLSRYGDAIAQRTALSGSWIGLALLATVTPLPEPATGITSVTVAHAPNLAVGDALGSCVANLVFLVVIDFFFRKEPVWHRASQGHVSGLCLGIQAWAIPIGHANSQTMIFTVLALGSDGPRDGDPLRDRTTMAAWAGCRASDLRAANGHHLRAVPEPHLQTAPLTIAELALCLAAAEVVWVVLELEKAWRRTRSGSTTEVAVDNP
jgi:hypothetical protein